MRRIWVCEECGEVWEADEVEEPVVRNNAGRPICAPCFDQGGGTT